VTSSYAPTTRADMHRARHLAWELPRLGWDTEILCPNSQFQRSASREPATAELFNICVPSHEAAPTADWLFRMFNMRSIGWRALWPLYCAGSTVLRTRRFDLIYFTTAHFPLFCLAKVWSRQFSIPCILDYHDPWVRDEVRYRTTRHTIKLRISILLSRWMERRTLEAAAGLVSVSPVYIDQLRRRYGNLPCLDDERCAVIPFAGRENDLMWCQRSEHTPNEQSEIVYVGAGGAIMARSFTAICEALVAVRQTDPNLFSSLKIRAFGTHSNWTNGDPRPLHEIAQRFGLGDVVEEHPAPISYSEAMQRVERSDGLLVLGVDDDGYVPSKLFSYAVSGKPLLASLRHDSPAKRFFDEKPELGNLIVFDRTHVRPRLSVDPADTMRTFLTQVSRRDRFDRRSSLAEYLSAGMASKHVAFFERVCAGAPA
jgi:hypothetical protein